jgi:hypothetical protein
MTEQRFYAHATLLAGESERRIDGGALQLVRVVLGDDGPDCSTDGIDHQRADVICALRPGEARALAQRLLALAEHAEQITLLADHRQALR